MAKKLKGHKPRCKCVGCSADTRKRGMKALGLAKSRPKHRNMKKRQALKVRRRIVKHVMGKVTYKASTIRKANRKMSKMTRRVIKRTARKISYPRYKNRPTPHFIGSNVSAPRHSFGRGSKLYTGPGLFSVTVTSARGGAPNGTVSRLDYDNPGKAQRAYGKRGRFFHIFKKSVRAVSVGNGKIRFTSSSPLWRASL